MSREAAASVVLEELHQKGRKGTRAQANEILRLRRCLQVHRIGVAPVSDQLVQVGEQFPMLNVNRHTVPKPVEHPLPLIDRMITHQVGGDKDAKKWLLNWCAFVTQNPEKRPNTAVVIYGEPGCGKSTLGKLIGYCRGSWAEINDGDIKGNFNGHWSEERLIVGKEITLAEDKIRFSQRLKGYITDTITVNRKNLPEYQIDNRTAWWLTSNTDQPVVGQRGDRRYSVFFAAKAPDDLERAMQETFSKWDPDADACHD